MKIKRIKTKNYRSLENIEVNFNSYYNAISGKNNSGKSNIIRTILSFLTYDFNMYNNAYIDGDLNYVTDYPYWKKKEKNKEDIVVEIELLLNNSDDTGLFKFIKELIFKDEEKFNNDNEILKIVATQKFNVSGTNISLFFGDKHIDDDYKKLELLNRLRSSKSVLFHNSTENAPPIFSRRNKNYVMSYLSKDELDSISKKKDILENSVKRSLKKHQTEFGDLLGRLSQKYDVSLGISSISIEREEIEISLKEKGIEVSLEDWGSGTKNRTLILMNLLNAKRVKQNSSINERLTPVVIVEEPESFLHPSAQAEFGRILQDISNEYQIQIIVATHSPYLLSHKDPTANILLERNLTSKIKGSKIINTEGEKWYEPFALSLGINGDDFGELKNTIFSETNDIILVEGDSDKEYLELLKHPKHGKNKLNFNGEIYSYGGVGNLKNNILLKFIIEKFKRFAVTIDLDKIHELKSTFNTLGLKENKEFIVVGKNETGKRCIEGLIPMDLLSSLYSKHANLVQKSMENSSEGKKARSDFKSEILKAFKKEDKLNNNSIFKEFYSLSNTINKIFK